MSDPDLRTDGIYAGLQKKACGNVPYFHEYLINSGHGGHAVMLPPPRHPDAAFREYYVYDTHGHAIGLVMGADPITVMSDGGAVEVFQWEASSFVSGDEFTFPTRGCAELWLTMVHDIFTSQKRRRGE